MKEEIRISTGTLHTSMKRSKEHLILSSLDTSSEQMRGKGGWLHVSLSEQGQICYATAQQYMRIHIHVLQIKSPKVTHGPVFPLMHSYTWSGFFFLFESHTLLASNP